MTLYSLNSLYVKYSVARAQALNVKYTQYSLFLALDWTLKLSLNSTSQLHKVHSSSVSTFSVSTDKYSQAHMALRKAVSTLPAKLYVKYTQAQSQH